MGLGKTYSTQYLADSNNNTGVAGQVLISTATGINWSDGTDIIGGPYLPLVGGTLTGALTGTSATFNGNTITTGTLSIGQTTTATVPLEVNGGAMLTNQRVDNAEKYPIGHYQPGETLFEIDTTWTDAQLRKYFNSPNVSWNADADAPGGYAIYISGGIGVGGEYGSGFPYIPVDDDGIYYMECYIKNVGTSQTHYMGSNEYNESFGSTGGNPGSYGYWVMANTNPGNTWTKVSGYITDRDASATGKFELGTKYWTPLALFNYGAGTGTRACLISGWKVIRVDSPGDRYFDSKVYINAGASIPSRTEEFQVTGRQIITNTGTNGPSLYLGYNSSGSNTIQLGRGRTADGLSYIDFNGEVMAAGDYGFRIMRNAGVNAVTMLNQVGTGNLQINAANGADTVFTNTNVGIGATSPAGKFEIKSAASNYTTAPAITFTDDTGVADSRWILGNIATNYGNFVLAESDSATTVNYSPRITVIPGGNVGISVTNPGAKLDVFDPSTTAANTIVAQAIKNYVGGSAMFRVGMNSGSTTADIEMNSGQGGPFRYGSYGEMNIVNNRLTSKINIVNNTSIAATIDSDGNVGIGVTGPDTKLHVFEAGTAMIRIDSGATSPYKAGIEFLRSSINGGRIYNDGGAVQIKLESDFAYDAANPTRGGFMFKTAPVTSAILVDAVRIDARGYVGIGTTLPSEKLEVAGNAVINGDLSVSNSFIDSNGNSGSSGQVLTSTSSGTSWSGASGNINTPTQLNLSLGEGYASNVREFLYRNRYRVSPANLSYRYALHFENPSMPEPSIELLPIGGRPGGGLINTAAAGLLFNISPRSTTLNTNGIFKTQRGTTATVVGSDQYIDIVDINEPRIDFTETTTGDFLMEPSSTNRTVSSVDFSTSSWSVDGVTIASFEGDAPDGSDEASTITEISGDTGRHSCFQVVSSSTSLINTFSFFAKYNGTAQFISIVLSNTTTWNSQFVVDLKNGVITKEASPSSSFTNTNKLEKHGDGWYRLISTIEGDFAGDNIYSRIVMSNVAVPPYPPLNTYTGRNNYNILIWGAQLEEQAFATSFIPTTTATVTRGAEISQGVQSYHGTYSSGNPQGTLFAEMSALGDNDNPAYNVDTKISLSNTANTFDNYVTIGFSRFDGNVFAEITSGGTLQTVNFGATGVDKTKMNKYALAWNDGFMRFFVNGVQTNSEHVSAPNINTLQFSAAVTSSQRFQGRVKSLKVYKEMLTPEQLGTLSSWSSFDEMALSQNYTIY